MARALGALSLLGSTLSCATSGSAWLNQPLSSHVWGDDPAPQTVAPSAAEVRAEPLPRVRPRVISEAALPNDGFQPGASDPSGASGFFSANGNGANASANARLVTSGTVGGGRVLGTFRNTYYDFPSEADFSGDTVALENAHCKPIKRVARAFYEAVCVQGSGTLSTGSTVSFAKRDCDCAESCPRTGQRICFDELDARAFPWGRGATGRAITPLLSIAVDTDLVPLDTPVYIPEYDGAPRDPSRRALHDGCFIAQDRGVRVKGEHVDIFTGQREITALWNELVPSNRGVTVVLDSPRCARATLPR